MEALLHVADQTKYIDITRVAIHGWSYGKVLFLSMSSTVGGLNLLTTYRGQAVPNQCVKVRS